MFLNLQRPTEMKVLSERPQHLDNLPQEPEKFYNSGNFLDSRLTFQLYVGVQFISLGYKVRVGVLCKPYLRAKTQPQF